MASLTEQINNLYTSTWRSMGTKVEDQIYDSTPWFFWLKSKGKLRALPGGRRIDVPLQHAKYDSAQWVVKGGVVDLSDREVLQTAQFDWRYLIGYVVRFWQEDQQNRGRHQIVNLMNAKMQNAIADIRDTLETQTFSTAGATTNAIDGLQHLVADDPTSSLTVGGIDQSTTPNAFWRNKATNMTGESFAAFGPKRMRTMLNNVSNTQGNARPDIILTGQDPYEFYADSMLGYYQFTDKSLVDAGFTNLAWEGIPIVWAPACGTRMYFLNTRYIWMYFDPAWRFQMGPWLPIANQPNDVVSYVSSALSHVTNRRRALGVIYNIDTE